MELIFLSRGEVSIQDLSVTDKMNQTQVQLPGHPLSPSVLTKPPLYTEPWAGPLGHTMSRTPLPRERHDKLEGWLIYRYTGPRGRLSFLEMPSGNLKSRLSKDLVPRRNEESSAS